MASALFDYIAGQQPGPWGAVLDAGAGLNSLGWICGLATDRWTAVTAHPGHLAQLRARFADSMRTADRLVLGNWADAGLLAGEAYDTVFADYLLGAVEAFAPFYQDSLFARLRPHVAGRLYVVGAEPYVYAEPETPSARMVWRIGRLRDACLTLAGEIPYREHPSAWTAAALERSGFRILASRLFANRYRAPFVDAQLNMCLQRLPRIGDAALAQALAARVDALRREALDLEAAEGGLRCGHDYVIVAAPAG